MKRSLEAFLLRQLSDPWPAQVLDLPKTALVVIGFTLEGKVYHGTQDLEEVEYQEYLESTGKRTGKVRGKVTRAQLCKPAETVTAEGSVIRKLREKRLVTLLCNQSLESGPYDVYQIADLGRGFTPWDGPDDSVRYTIEPENEFSNLWVPVRSQGRSYFVPWRMVTGWPLKGEPGAIGGYIDLSSALESQHRKMVANAY
jgi:hypothetical protein